MSAIRGVQKFIPFEKSIENKTTELKSSKSQAETTETQQSENQKVREVADLYEKFFIKELMRHMKSGLNEDGGIIKKNNAEKIFSEQLDEQYSEQWNKRGGFGLSDMIYDNITQKFGADVGKSQPKDQLAKTDDFSHEQMLWQIEMDQKTSKK